MISSVVLEHAGDLTFHSQACAKGGIKFEISCWGDWNHWIPEGSFQAWSKWTSLFISLSVRLLCRDLTIFHFGDFIISIKTKNSFPNEYSFLRSLLINSFYLKMIASMMNKFHPNTCRTSCKFTSERMIQEPLVWKVIGKCTGKENYSDSCTLGMKQVQ